jgi:hypothetical protein
MATQTHDVGTAAEPDERNGKWPEDRGPRHGLDFTTVMVRLLMAWIVLVAVLSFITVPWLSAGNGGDLTAAQVWFYHALMLPSALLFLILATRVFVLHAWVKYLVTHSALVAMFEGIGFLILGYGTQHHVSSLVDFGYWVIMPATLELFGVTALFVIDLAWIAATCALVPERRAVLSPRKAEMTWAFSLTGVSVLTWVVFGIVAAADQVGLSWNFWAQAQKEPYSALMGNVITAHSHGMLPSFMAAIVLLAAEAFGYSKMIGPRAQVARSGVGVMLGGIALYSGVYAVSALGTFVIPAWFPTGKGGANGIAMDDTFTGLMGVGALIVAGAMLPELKGLFVRATTGAGRALQKLNPLRAGVYLSYLSAAIALFIYGYYIEMHETTFGLGQSGPHMMNDQVFSRSHLLFAFGSLPIIAVFLLAVELTANSSARGLAIRQAMGTVIMSGMLVTLAGMGIWVFGVGGHSANWGAGDAGEVLYAIGQSLMVIGAIVSLFTPRLTDGDDEGTIVDTPAVATKGPAPAAMQ